MLFKEKSEQDVAVMPMHPYDEWASSQPFNIPKALSKICTSMVPGYVLNLKSCNVQPGADQAAVDPVRTLSKPSKAACTGAMIHCS